MTSVAAGTLNVTGYVPNDGYSSIYLTALGTASAGGARDDRPSDSLGGHSVDRSRFDGRRQPDDDLRHVPQRHDRRRNERLDVVARSHRGRAKHGSQQGHHQRSAERQRRQCRQLCPRYVV